MPLSSSTAGGYGTYIHICPSPAFTCFSNFVFVIAVLRFYNCYYSCAQASHFLRFLPDFLFPYIFPAAFSFFPVADPCHQMLPQPLLCFLLYFIWFIGLSLCCFPQISFEFALNYLYLRPFLGFKYIKAGKYTAIHISLPSLCFIGIFSCILCKCACVCTNRARHNGYKACTITTATRMFSEVALLFVFSVCQLGVRSRPTSLCHISFLHFSSFFLILCFLEGSVCQWLWRVVSFLSTPLLISALQMFSTFLFLFLFAHRNTYIYI